MMVVGGRNKNQSGLFHFLSGARCAPGIPKIRRGSTYIIIIIIIEGRGSTFNIIIIIEGLSLLQRIPPTTANKQTQAQKKRGGMARKLLGANAKSYRLKLKLKLSSLVSTNTDYPPASTGWQPPSTVLGPAPASA